MPEGGQKKHIRSLPAARGPQVAARREGASRERTDTSSGLPKKARGTANDRPGGLSHNATSIVCPERRSAINKASSSSSNSRSRRGLLRCGGSAFGVCRPRSNPCPNSQRAARQGQLERGRRGGLGFQACLGLFQQPARGIGSLTRRALAPNRERQGADVFLLASFRHHLLL